MSRNDVDIFQLDKVGNDTFRQDKTCIRSYSKEFFESMCQLPCANCSSFLYSKNEPPMIAFCGHFVHDKCGKREHDNHYYCKICDRDVEETDENKPLLDAVISNLFNAKQNGKAAMCRHKNVCKMHASANMVHFPGSGDTKYYCVWCVAKKEKDTFNNYSASRIINFEYRSLSTLDRIENVSGWALDTCCLCMGVGERMELRDKKDKNIVHLSCNHICHEGCEKKEDTCKLCGVKYDPKQSKVRKWLGKYYLDGYTEETYNQCRKCFHSHPQSSLVETPFDVRCVWCVVKMLGKKEQRIPHAKPKATPSSQKTTESGL